MESVTLAELVVRGGEVVHEQYGPDTDATTALISWSTWSGWARRPSSCARPSSSG
jgi:hypothetical protein